MSTDPNTERQADTAAQPPPAPERPASRGGRTGGIIASSVLGLFGLLILIGGLALIAVHAFARDDDGFYSTDDEQLESSGYALATDEIDFGGGVGGFGADDLSATVRIDATSVDGRPLFVGIGPTTDVAQYLDGVAHTEVVDFGDGGPDYAQHTGGRPAGPPASQDFWVAQSEGRGQQRVDWDLDNGNYTAVAMNAGATRGVAVDVDVGAKISWLIWVGVGMTVVGLLIVGGAILLISRLGRERRAEPGETRPAV
jgi:hypothetical protein